MSDQTGHWGEKSLLVDSRQDPGQGIACPGDSATYHLRQGPGKSGMFPGGWPLSPPQVFLPRVSPGLNSPLLSPPASLSLCLLCESESLPA